MFCELVNNVIYQAVIDLKAVTENLGRTEIGKRAALIDPESMNGLKPVMRIYEDYLHLKNQPSFMSDKLETTLREFKEGWYRFFDALDKIITHRKTRAAIRKAQETAHKALVSALNGVQTPNTERIYDEFSAALLGATYWVSDYDEKNNVVRVIMSLLEKIAPFIKSEGSCKFTVPQVATLFSVNDDKVYNWEKGRSTPPSTKDGSLVYSARMRLCGDLSSLLAIRKDYEPIRRTGNILNSKRRESYNDERKYDRIDD